MTNPDQRSALKFFIVFRQGLFKQEILTSCTDRKTLLSILNVTTVRSLERLANHFIS